MINFVCTMLTVLAIERIPVSKKCFHLMQVYLINGDLFLQPTIKDMVGKLLRLYVARNEDIIVDDLPFEQLLLDLMEQYASNSYGDATFGEIFHVFLQMKIADSKYRLMIWSDLLHTLRSLESTPYSSLDGYLFPVESNVDLLKVYESALINEKVTKVLQHVTLHHLTHFLFDSGSIDWIKQSSVQRILQQAIPVLSMATFSS